MNELRLKYPVRMMRRIMNVSASGYYAWVDRPLSKRAQEEVRLELEIRAAHQRNRQTYGPERLQCDLAEHGVRVGVCRIKRIRQKLGIRCNPNPPKDTDGRREGSGRGWVRELQGRWPGVLG